MTNNRTDSVRAKSLTFAIHNLCKYPEYLEPLRLEITQNSTGKYLDNCENLPLLDSFLKESARTNPLDSRKSGASSDGDQDWCSDGQTYKCQSRDVFSRRIRSPVGFMSPLGTGLPLPKGP